jgi:hypothetical protein
MSLKSLIPGFLKKIALKIYLKQFKLGFPPQYLALLSEKHFFSATNSKWDFTINKGIGGFMEAPNTSSGYHGILKQWWEKFQLGEDCLLISESKKVREVFEKNYPDTKFMATDYYVDLIEGASTDVLWNLYEDIPEAFKEIRFSSIVCQATFEHLIDPVGILKKFIALSKDTSHIFMHTHTPYYPKHNWPSDYLRYYPEWFSDVTGIVRELTLLEMYAEKGHIFVLFKVEKKTT